LLLGGAFLFLLTGFAFSRLGAATPAPSAAGEEEMKALAAAWPDRIPEVAFRDGDWMLRMDDRWYAWAHGRLLPEDEASRWQDFSVMPFYTYPLVLSPLPELSAEAAALLRARVRENARHPPRRSEEFLGSLLKAATRSATEAMLVRTEVAGFSVTVHKRLKGPLARVSEKLRALRLTDPQVDSFLSGLREMNGYSFRDVAGTNTRSLHSFGLALDLIPRSYHGTDSYWMWAMSKTPDWWTIPYERRWMVPLPIVQAFENEGFVWGGKWLFFDTMHFEYRPEMLLLAQTRAARGEEAQPGSISAVVASPGFSQ
jgi:hypothetical protein